MIKALLIVATLNGAIGYDSMTVCEDAAERLNKVQGEKIAVCIPAGKTKQDMMFDKFLDMINNLSKKDNISVDKQGN